MSTRIEEPPESDDSRGALPGILLALVLLALLALIGWWLFGSDDETGDVTETTPSITTPVTTEAVPVTEAATTARIATTTTTVFIDEATFAVIPVALVELDGYDGVVELLTANDLVEPLSEPGPFTVFAPTDAAIASLGPVERDTALGNGDLTTDVLRYHVVPGIIDPTDTDSAETLLGEALTFEDGRVNDTASFGEPVIADNGVIYSVDHVLIPSQVQDLIDLERSMNALVATEPVMFDLNESVIKPGSEPKLLEVVGLLTGNDANITLEGHTDSLADDAFNQALSEARASAVRTFFVENGVDASRLTTVGFGESQPIADNDTEEGRAQNRRVVFRAS